MDFKDRIREIDEINQILIKKGFQLIIIYGRRRIGKTELILQTTKTQKRLYYLAVGENNLERFYKKCTSYDKEMSNLKIDYEVLIRSLKDKLDILIIDEFQNMIREDLNILNLFQAIIDGELRESNIKLFLIGSSISMIISNVLNHSSPLYGRRTGSLKLKAIEFYDLKAYFPELEFQELIEIYSFADGIPYYLNEIITPFWTWFSNELKRPSNIFKDEVDFLMRYEFNKPSNYKLILEAISRGKTKLGEIKDFVGLKRTDISPYLKNLIDIDMIFREVPITDNINSRHGRYHIKDNFIRFWFRFIYPNLSAIEEGILNIELIKKDYPTYLGKIFEEVVKNLIVRCNILSLTKIGRWWWKDREIDLITFNELTGEITFIECKWQEQVNSLAIVSKLVEKTEHVHWRLNDRIESYMVFAKSFSKRIDRFENKPVKCFSVEDLFNLIK